MIRRLLPLFGNWKCYTLTSLINFTEVNLPFKEDAKKGLSVSSIGLYEGVLSQKIHNHKRFTADRTGDGGGRDITQ